ncbi:MAG: hypothetical protein ACK4VW_03680 [Anaerolineales bacterium]
MPQPTRWFVKASLLYLFLALLFGILQTANLGYPFNFFPTYLHLLTFGWLTQLIFGIALWMFPAYSRERPRGPSWVGWSIFVALNLGLLLRLLFEPWHGIRPSPLGERMLILSAILQWLAGVAFFLVIWPRIKGR